MLYSIALGPVLVVSKFNNRYKVAFVRDLLSFNKKLLTLIWVDVKNMSAINENFIKFSQLWSPINELAFRFFFFFLQNLILDSKFNTFFVLWPIDLKPNLDVWKFKNLSNSFGFSYWKLQTFKFLTEMLESVEKTILQHNCLNLEIF